MSEVVLALEFWGFDTCSLTTSANNKTEAGAPGLTGTSPGQAIGTDEVQDQSNTRQESEHGTKTTDNSTESTGSGFQSKSKAEQKGSSSSSTDTLDVVTEPPVRANSPTPSGAPGATGTSPNQPLGRDASRDDSSQSQNHHKRNVDSSSRDTSSTDIKASDASKSEGKPSASGNPKTGPGVTANSKKSDFDGPNASFSSEIGSKDDPARVAEQRMFEQNAQRGDVGSMGKKQDSITGGGQFDVLKSEEAA
ncbi:hypothetical protein FKW77_000746 [Venturia effusa]|uniref:Uncharacterized protein n=1 Tax=Venturia effusa TaxID=50376 RepID=A0A517L8G9_9PEZI|nr:hypothetical protein FKW77_000746 [Venturia effusa]